MFTSSVIGPLIIKSDQFEGPEGLGAGSVFIRSKIVITLDRALFVYGLNWYNAVFSRMRKWYSIATRAACCERGS